MESYGTDIRQGTDERSSMDRVGNILNVEGKVALITGAGQGVGRQVAIHLASYGASVVVNDFFGDRAAMARATWRGRRGRRRAPPASCVRWRGRRPDTACGRTALPSARLARRRLPKRSPMRSR